MRTKEKYVLKVNLIITAAKNKIISRYDNVKTSSSSSTGKYK